MGLMNTFVSGWTVEVNKKTVGKNLINQQCISGFMNFQFIYPQKG